MIRVILADEQSIVRHGIRILLEQDGRFDVIGEVSDAGELFEVLDKGVIPEIILADVILPELLNYGQNLKFDNGFTPKFVLLTITDDDDHMVKAFASGVMGYLLKNISAPELIFALSYVHSQNKKYISADLALRLLDRIDQLPRLTLDDTDGFFTKRESEVLELIAEGYTNQQMADKLFTSRRTVEGHRQALMDKANVSNSAALVKFAFRNKLIN